MNDDGTAQLAQARLGAASFAGDVAGARKAVVEDRTTEVMYHVGRPGHDGYVERVLQAWGVDGHNSHTNVCSAAARLGYTLWSGYDRPSPDYENAKFTLLISAHLETGHYFNPHAQRIIEAKERGAKICAIDTRLSNTASKADYWMPTYPGTEAAVLLAMCHLLLERGLSNRDGGAVWRRAGSRVRGTQARRRARRRRRRVIV